MDTASQFATCATACVIAVLCNTVPLMPAILADYFGVAPDIIVLDYLLPDINADVVCKTIHSNPSLENTRIILISAHIDEHEQAKIKEMGVDAFLRKPFQIEELVNRIGELLNL